MAKYLKTLVAMSLAGGALFGARSAMAASSVHGVAFVHGTGDYAGSQSCTGTGTGFYCVVSNALSNYWTQAEVDAVRGGRPYAVTGQHGGTMTPWANPSPYKNSGSETSTGTAYEVASQLNRFLAGPNGVYGDADDITDLVAVTHSGGSNVIRYIVQHPTINTNFAHVQARLRKIIAVAPPSRGTYLADRVFANDGSLTTLAGSALAGLMGFKDDGTKFIQTTEMSSTNYDSAKFVNMNSSQGGVPFYASGGLSTQKCFGVTVWGKCLGVTAGSLGGSNCDSFLMDTGLAALHNAFLNTNDSGTARNSCSDGFISCASAQAIGTSFGFSLNQDHNQSRRKCNGEDTKIASQVSSAIQGFSNEAYSEADVPVKQWDSCGFSTYAAVTSGADTIGYTAGCQKSDLGDGSCDWDCVATYGHDATPTWDASGTKVVSWGTTDDCSGTLATGTAPVGFTTTNDPWATGGYYAGDPGTYTSDGTNWYYTGFSGKKVHGAYTNTYSDPNNASNWSIGYCPQSWIGDGVCDECVLAAYGNDGNDCLPGKVSACGGIVSLKDPRANASQTDKLYDERVPLTTMVSYSANNTASATQYTTDVTINVIGGSVITLSTNGASSCKLSTTTSYSSSTGDTYIRLYDPSGNQVASNDDSCSTTQSYLTYTAKVSGNFTFKIGCYGSGSCSGTAGYKVDAQPLFWNEVACTGSDCLAQNANGVCDIGECTRNNWNPCSLDSDCLTGTCQGGYCSDSASTCNADSDCVSGTCVNGGCTTAGADCSTTKSDGTLQSLCR